MTDVRKSKLSANERPKSSTKYQKGETNKRKGSANIPPSGDDSSVYSSESGSSSSETTGDNRSSKSRKDTDYLLVDSNNFEERAKRFLETMPAERRKEWLRQQGYAYSRDGLLIPPTEVDRTSARTETSFQNNPRWRRFSHTGGSGNGAYGSGDENQSHAVERGAGGRGQDSESRSESESTPSHDCVSASSDAEEDGCLEDDKRKEAGNDGQWADVAERPASESPNAVIKNRFARLMARMSDVGGGFPEMGDMEITTVHEENSGNESESSTNEIKRNNMEAGTLQRQQMGDRRMKVVKTDEDDVECTQSEANKVKPGRVKEVAHRDRGNAKVQFEEKVVVQDVNISREHAKTQVTSKYSCRPGLSSKLKDAYRPVVDEAVVSVMGDVNMAQRAKGLQQDKHPNRDAVRKSTVETGAERGNTATPARGEAIVKKRRDSGGTYVIADQTSTSTTDDRGTIRCNSSRGGRFNETSLPGQDPGELQRIVDPVCESKETPLQLISGEKSQDDKSRSVESEEKSQDDKSRSVESEDALVTFKNQPREDGEERIGSSVAKNSNCYKHRLDGENFQNVNDNFQDYSKRTEYQAQRGLSDTGELSEAEIKLANLRKLVDKELVKNALRNSQLNADLPGSTRMQANSSDPSTADARNKQGGDDKKGKESSSASPCFVTGNKMNVSKKIRCCNISKTVSVPVPRAVPVSRAKVSSTQSLLGKATMSNKQVIVEKRPMKRAVNCERLETIPETSSVSSCQSSDSSNAQRKQKTEQISRAVKVNKTPVIISRPKLIDEKPAVGFESSENGSQAKKSQQDSFTKDKQTLSLPTASAPAATTISQQANKVEKKTTKLQLPLIKPTTNKPKTGQEKTANAILKLPKIKTEENQRVGEHARSRKDASTDRGFLPPVTNDTREKVSVAYKSTPVHLPNVQRTTVESTKSKGVSDKQIQNRNNASLRTPSLNSLASSQCGEKELKTKQSLQRKLPEIVKGKHEGAEIKELKKDPEARSTPSGTRDAKVKQGFNQIEAEIQREIDTQLKKAKQTKSAPPKGSVPKSLSAKEKSRVNAKMDALDELSEDDGEVGEDESDFLSRIVSSDCRLTMYGNTKDAPLIRKTGASALDTMKESLGVGDVSRKGNVTNCGDDGDTSTAAEGRQCAKGKCSYKDIKSNALRSAKQKALLAIAQGRSQDAGDGTSPDSDAMLNKSSNALVARDDISQWVESNTLLGDHSKENVINNCDQSKDCLPSIFDQADEFDVDVLILDESSYVSYGNSSRRYGGTICLNSFYNASLDLTKERNTNANNSKGGSDVEENMAQNQGLTERAQSTIMDKENRDCVSSSLNASKELRTRGSNKDTARSSRIPVRAAARKRYEPNKCSGQATRHKTVSFQCDKIPQRLVVILNNRDGLKVGQAEAPIIFTDGEAIRYCNQAAGSSNRDESYTVEIRGESTEPAHAAASPSNFQVDEWRKLPLSERLKKYQKAKPRNIHSGTYQKADRAVSADVKQRASNSTGQQSVKPSSLEKTSSSKRNGPERPATDDKIRDQRGTPKQTHHDLVGNIPKHSNESPKRTLHKPLLRPDLSPQADNIHRSTNLISQCELFSTTSSLRTTQDHEEDDLPTIDALKGGSTSKHFNNGGAKRNEPKAAQDKTNWEQKEDTEFEVHMNSSPVADYMQSSRRRTVVDRDKPVKSLSSVEYEPTPDVDDSLQLFLHHEQALAQVKTPEAQSDSVDPVRVDHPRGVGASTSEDDDSVAEEDLCQKSRDRDATRSPAYTAGERRDDDIGSNSPRRPQYSDSLKCTPLHHSLSEDEGTEGPGQKEQWQREPGNEEQGQEEETQEEAKSTYLQLIYKKVKNHLFERSKDDPHDSPGKHSITAEDVANNETPSISMSHEELGREDGTPSELGGESPDEAETSYYDRTRNSLHSNDDSVEMTYSIATAKQAPDTADTKDTDIENISISDVITNENHPLNSRMNSATNANKMATQLRQKNHMDPKQIVLKKMANGFAPTPATSSPIRSKQAKRPKGNLFDKVAFTSEESLAEGAGPSSKNAAPFSDTNKNESRISMEKGAVGGKHCDFEKRRPETKPCNSRTLNKNHKDFNVGTVRSERKSVPRTSHKAAERRTDMTPSGTRTIGASSSGQANHSSRSLVPSEALRDDREKLATRASHTYSPGEIEHSPEEAASPGDARGSDASQAEFSPWPHDQGTREDGLVATALSPTRPTADAGNNDDRDSAARKKKTDPHPRPETLPPLCNRQTGLPHRPKVKRYY